MRPADNGFSLHRHAHASKTEGTRPWTTKREVQGGANIILQADINNSNKKEIYWDYKI